MKKAFVDVYIAEIPAQISLQPLSHSARNEEILNVKNENVKRQKYCVWKLLEHALQSSLGIDVASTDIRKSSTGKWIASQFECSLSHSSHAVAVAVSNLPVGIDIEENKPHPNEDKLAEFILTPDELVAFQDTPADKKSTFLIQKWTAKEGAFKKSGGASFQPRTIHLDPSAQYTISLTAGGKEHILSVVSDCIDTLKIHDPIKL